MSEAMSGGQTGAQTPELSMDGRPGKLARPGIRSLEEAAQWFATLRDEQVSEREREAWQHWLAMSPEHARAWRYVEAVSQKFEPLRPAGSVAANAGVQAVRRIAVGRRKFVAGAVSAVGLGLTAYIAWRATPLPGLTQAMLADYRSGTGEQRNITLPDGTRVWLNTATALNVDYQPGLRRIALIEGEVLVETAKDSAGRPFYVDTSMGRLQALGTRFTVFLDGPQTRLDVFDGVVEVRNAGGMVQRVQAGQAARFDRDVISPLGSAQHGREAWRRNVIVADNTRLEDLLRELSRYFHGHIGVSPAVADLKVMGVFPSNDPQRALALLEHSLPVRVRKTLPWWLTVQAR